MLSPPPAHPAQPRAGLPSVDRVLAWPGLADALAAHGRSVVLAGVRDELAAQRGLLAAVADGPSPQVPDADMLLSGITHRIQAAVRPTLRPVFNLTGTVLHTNLGRAPLPQQALDAITAVARGAANLEFDLAAGARGDRDDVVAGLLQQLTGAEAATVVNNTAAALVLVLAALAPRREVIVSRGELIEIGGAFRLPDIMRSAGCKLHEVGTTNRTHLRDHAEAIGPRTAMLLKVHTSNYQIQGFSAAVDTADLAPLARAHGLPLVVDLGSGALLDLARWGLPHEPTAAETLAAGADLVLFSGDKLLGGPQAGIIVGRADLVRRLKKHPFKRALRCDKLTLAALEAVLRLYADPDRLAAQLPTLRLLVRPLADIQAQAQRLQPLLAGWLGAAWQVTVADVMSQIGSGALPVDLLPSAALRLQPANMRRGAGRALDALAAGLRALPLPVVGRVADGALWLDLRCLDDEAGFADQLQRATLPGLTAPSAPPAAPVPRAASASTAAPAAPT